MGWAGIGAENRAREDLYLEVTIDVTGQIKVKNVRLFGLGNIGEQNVDVKLKQSQRIGMDSVSEFVSIIYCAL